MSQQNITTLQSAINTQLADNTSGDISAADVRDNLINMTDSLLFNSGSQGITGSLTADSFTGSLQGTATTASYVLNAVSSSFANTASFVQTAQTASYVLNAVSASRAETSSITDVATKLTITGAGGVGTLYPTLVGISAGDLNVSTKASNLFFTQTTSQLFATSISSSFTGSLRGTSTTASYVAGANVDGVVAGATNAVNSALTYTSKTDTNGEYKVLFTDNLNLDDNSELYKENGSTFTYNPGLNRLSLSRILADNFTGSLQGTATAAVSASYAATASVLLGSVTSASYAATSSLSDETIGAGDPLNTSGGEIQFRGGFGPGSPNGKNTWSSVFTWNPFTSGLNIGDPNTTGGNGAYYLATGVESLANGNYSVSHGSSSMASGEGSFTHGKAITATGEYSHAEGLGTIASGSYQHVQGRFNTQGDSTSLMIVGNGTADGSRKDAFKVRMSGSIILPTTQSTAPSWTGTDGEMVFATVTGNHRFYVWMAGAWRSGSLA
jgi:hypothetical protein